MTTTSSPDWATQFAKITASNGFSVRTGQEHLGNEIISTLDNKGVLLGVAPTGTGKSLCSILPIIFKIHQAKKEHKTYRGVVTTETITLMNQIYKKDLPELHSIYGNFTYAKLMGRSNYYCADRASAASIGNNDVNKVVKKINQFLGSLSTGERSEIESVSSIGKIDDDVWMKICSDSQDCNDASCDDPNTCFTVRAREKAASSDIIITNHSLLAVDLKSKEEGISGEGILGAFDALVIDEAHKVEETFAGQWEEAISWWDIADHTSRFIEGADIIKSFSSHAREEDDDSVDPDIDAYMVAVEDFNKFYNNAIKLFARLEERDGRVFEGSEHVLALKYLTDVDADLERMLLKYEIDGLNTMINISERSEPLIKWMEKIVAAIPAKGNKKKKKIAKKSLTSARFFSRISSLLSESLASENGIISYKGGTFGMIAEGRIRKKNDEQVLLIRSVPVDISRMCSKMWKSVDSVVFLSATLEDLTENSLRYFRGSLGIPDSAREISVASPFDNKKQQLVYVTSKQFEPEEGSVFSIDEIVNAVNMANGRSLLLFTSRREIEMAEEKLLEYKMQGKFMYPMLVQTPGADKAKLVEEFKANNSSVLLGLKSMFTGIDIPGESLSLVVICRFPLPRYSTECRMKIKYWAGRGFPAWYERESLTVFQQAAGRLIRSQDCVGVVALMDQRAYDQRTNVFKASSKGVMSLGSPVTHDLGQIRSHLDKQ